MALIPILAMLAWADDSPNPEQRVAAQKLSSAGNYAEAYEGFRGLALDGNNDPERVGGDLRSAVNSLRQLGRDDEIDAFLELVVETHADNWRLLQDAAQTVKELPHYGYLVAGQFYRGNKRGGGEYVNTIERDRVRALQLMLQARGKLPPGSDVHARAQFHFNFASTLLFSRAGGEAWQLQVLTDLATLPEYEPGYPHYYGRSGFGSTRGAPVDAEGNPVLYAIPESYEAAQSDGERWRWMLAEAARIDDGRANEAKWIFAGFLREQFGVQTMVQYMPFVGRRADGDQDENAESLDEDTGPYAVQTLADDETIARLATGIKRFKLPDEFNFIAIYRQIAESSKNSYAEQSLNTLAEIFENRRQYPKAAEYWRKSIKEFGPGSSQYKNARLRQIVGNWGRFENVTVQPAGTGATVEYRFRNGRRVHFEARRIKIDQLLTDVKTYLRSNPAKLDYNQLNLSQIGYRLMEERQSKYVGDQVAAWDVDLQPRPNHFDTRMTVTTPLQTAGAYLLTAKMAGGQSGRIVLWISDTAIVKKGLNNGTYYFVGDAASGEPVSGANVEFFGFQQKSDDRNRYRVLTKDFAETTDANGQVMPDSRLLSSDYQWVTIARTGSGRLAFMGFEGVWYGTYYDHAYEQSKAFLITDRPVYRPSQPVKFKCWIREAKYDLEGRSQFAFRSFSVEITNPKGEVAFKKELKADEYGGIEDTFELPDDATLGQYSISVSNPRVGGGGSFRVEEYKKPEFEVTVEAPSKPVMLGEKITASINARYYFGAPVANAKVHYKVLRSNHSATWFPYSEWDWLYGPGYWWFCYDYTWYPGWHHWGCLRPMASWWPVRQDPPEVVLENEVEIGPDGTVTIEIDTALAKELHGDVDHRYDITAEVVDRSRRTIVGTGSVLVAREPFKVFSWADRGHYRVGDTVKAHFKAQTLDLKPVQGAGTAKLYSISYDAAGKPVEHVAEEWKLATNEVGEATLQLKASEAGQYRLSYQVTDNEGRTAEGAFVFLVMGEGFDGTAYRFNDIEIIPDKREYKAGETVKLLVNTNRVGGTVLLFVRPSNGIYLPPKIVRLNGKSTIEDIAIVQKDMPNFFVEALTISGGKVHTDVREIAVPPEKRILNVDVVASASDYKPGAPAKISVKLTDLLGKPFVGSTVLSVYDKSVEYISGGSNVSDIKEFFWGWRRSHYPQTETNLARYFGNMLRRGEVAMGDLGVFGRLVGNIDKDGNGLREDTLNVNDSAGRGIQAKSFAAESRMVADEAAPASPSAGGGGEAPLVQPTVRKEFADTALWVGSITTDREGRAEFSLTMPENLTTWKVRAWAMGNGTQVGQGDTEVITTKSLLVRMQAPRFFTETDEVVLSANIHNYLPTAKQAQILLELDGETLAALGSLSHTVEIAAGGEQRVDWRVKVAQPGEAIVRMKALTDEESDAMEMRFPAYVHGALVKESFTGTIRPNENTASIDITVPARRKVKQTLLEIQYSPSLAVALVDALPYLVNSPYKTTESTLNRFLPTVITQNILKGMNLNLEAIRDKRTNLNAQEIGDPVERAAQWKRYKRNPVFDNAEVEHLVKEGVMALTEMQLSDGGWGWFSGWGEHSDAHTTALVLHGLQIAQKNGVAIVPDVMERGKNWLVAYQKQQVKLLENAPKTEPYKTHADNIDALVFMVLADAGTNDKAMLNFLDRDRTRLDVYAKALFGLALETLGEKDKLAEVMRNLKQYLVQDEENQTAYLKLPNEGYWWFWYGSDIEANAFYLKLLAKTDPKSQTAPRLVKYLLNNRKHASCWNSTRDTAYCVEAMAEYLKATGEDRPEMTVEVFVDGQKRTEVSINADNLFTFNNSFVMAGEELGSGPHRIELRKQGRGPLYYNAYLTNFTLDEFITRAGLEIKVNRKYYKLLEQTKEVVVSGSRGQAIDQASEKYVRQELVNFANLQSGDLVEVELEIDSKNDYEYLMFEDPKAAGFEPVEVQSGYDRRSLGAYIELRDEKVTFFVRRLARGKHSVSYRLRAEIPGKFSALPTQGLGMYAPELKANSDEFKISILDSEIEKADDARTARAQQRPAQ